MYKVYAVNILFVAMLNVTLIHVLYCLFATMSLINRRTNLQVTRAVRI